MADPQGGALPELVPLQRGGGLVSPALDMLLQLVDAAYSRDTGRILRATPSKLEEIERMAGGAG